MEQCPNRLEEFKQTNGDWSGEESGRDLFIIWKAAGGSMAIDPAPEIVDDLRESDGSIETYELLEVVSSNDSTDHIDPIDIAIVNVENEADLTSEIRQMIEESNREENYISDAENIDPVQTAKKKKKPKNPILSSQDYLNGIKFNQQKKDEKVAKSKEKRASRLVNAKKKIEQMNKNIEKLEEQVKNDQKKIDH